MDLQTPFYRYSNFHHLSLGQQKSKLRSPTQLPKSPFSPSPYDQYNEDVEDYVDEETTPTPSITTSHYTFQSHYQHLKNQKNPLLTFLPVTLKTYDQALYRLIHGTTLNTLTHDSVSMPERMRYRSPTLSPHYNDYKARLQKKTIQLDDYGEDGNNRLNFTLPSDYVNGNVSVRDGSTRSNEFYLVVRPTLTAVSNCHTNGSTVVLSGERMDLIDFQAAPCVRIGETTTICSLDYYNNGTLMFEVPARAGGQNVSLDLDGFLTNSVMLEYFPPRITSFQQTKTTGRIDGLDFGDESSNVQILFGSTPGSITTPTKTNHSEIIFTLPPDVYGQDQMWVMVNGQSSVNLSISICPVILSSTSSPLSGGDITISGQNFHPPLVIIVADVNCPVISHTKTSIICRLGRVSRKSAHPSDSYNITVFSGSLSNSADIFKLSDNLKDKFKPDPLATTLGSGGFGTVEQQKWRNLLVAVKKITIGEQDEDALSYIKYKFIREAYFMALSDFGIAKEFAPGTNKSLTQAGNPFWCAPEVNSRKYTEKADVFSYGFTIYEMFTRHIPFESCSSQQAKELISRGIRPQFPSNCPQQWQDFISLCWSHNPDLRPSFATIVSTIHGLPNSKVTENMVDQKKMNPVDNFELILGSFEDLSSTIPSPRSIISVSPPNSDSGCLFMPSGVHGSVSESLMKSKKKAFLQ
eukprot:gene16092-19149_t